MAKQSSSPQARAARDYAKACAQVDWAVQNVLRIRASLGRDASAYTSALHVLRAAVRWRLAAWGRYAALGVC